MKRLSVYLKVGWEGGLKDIFIFYLYVFILSLLIYIYVIGAKQFKADHETDLLKCLTKCFTRLYVIFYLQQYPQARLQSIINSFDA